MSHRGGLKPVLGFLVPASAIELVWLGSLYYLVQRFGAIALPAVVVVVLASMIAVLDATSASDVES